MEEVQNKTAVFLFLQSLRTRGTGRTGGGSFVASRSSPPHNLAGVLLFADLMGLCREMNRGRRRSEFFFLSPICPIRSVLVSPYRGISSRCSASALRSHRGKPRHRRKDPRTLAAFAGRLHRKSCCSCSRWSRRASVRQLGKQASWTTMSTGPQTTVLNRKSFTRMLFYFIIILPGHSFRKQLLVSLKLPWHSEPP